MPSLNSSNRNRFHGQGLAPVALAPPPRSIPLTVCGRGLFGGFINQFGWLWLGFSLVFVWIFVGGAGVKNLLFNFSQPETAPGVVLRTEETNASENDRSVYAIHYIFRVDQREAEYYGVSYTTAYSYAEGQAVEVEYDPAAPATSRVRGTRISTFGMGVLWILLFPLIGLAFVGYGLRRGIKGLRLLRSGNMASGTLIGKQRTNARVNEQMVYKLTFEFADSQAIRYQTRVKTHIPENLEDEATERILYDPRNPNYAVLFDDLPGRPEVDQLGRILPSGLLGSGLLLFFPALTLLILALMAR